MFQKYQELGFNVVPIRKNSKKSIITDWSSWSHVKQSLNLGEEWDQKYPVDKGFNIALMVGSASNINVLDVDTLNPKILEALPQSPILRLGNPNKFGALFFRHNPDLHNMQFGSKGTLDLVEFFCENKYVMIPPSVHEDFPGLRFTWATKFDLTNFDVNELPMISYEILDRISNATGKQLSETGGIISLSDGPWSSPDGTRCAHGSQSRLRTLASALVFQNKSIDEAIEELVNYDSKNHLIIPYFLDVTRSECKADSKSNAAKFYCNILHSINRSKINKGELPELPNEKPLVIDFKENKKESFELKKYPKPRGLMKMFVDYCESKSKGKQDALGLGGSIALLSTICSNRFRTKILQYDVWPNTFTINLAYSGFGKETPQRVIDDLFMDAELVGAGNYKSGSSLIAFLPTQQERIDLIDECSTILKAMNAREDYKSEIVEILSSLFSKSSTRFVGFTSVSSGQRFGACFNPCVNILGSTTPNGFRGSINRDMAAKGLMPRFLVFFQKEIGEYKIAPDQTVEFDQLKNCVYEILNIPKIVHKDFNEVPEPKNILEKNKHNPTPMGIRYNPILIPFSNEAQKAWLAFDIENHNNARQNPEFYESAFLARFGELSAKLALLDAVSLKRKTIEIDSFEWAREVVESQWYNVKLLYELASGENRYETNTIKVLNVIRESGGFIRKGDLSQKTRNLTPKELDEIVKKLIDSEILEEKKENIKGPGKKPTVYVMIDKNHILSDDAANVAN